MKFTFEVKTSELDEYTSIEDVVVDRAAERFIDEFLGSSYDKNSLSYQLEQKVTQKINEIFKQDFKDKVSERIITGLSDKFERSQAYKELIKNGDFPTDKEIHNELKELVHKLVKSEMGKIFSGK